MHLRIAVDARPLSGAQTGIARYTDQLLQAMLSSGHQWFLYSDKPLRNIPSDNPLIQIRHGHAAPRSASSLFFSQWQFRRWAVQDVVDLFWSPRHHLPLGLPRRIASVVTIHDLVWRRFPETMQWQNLAVERALMGASVRRAEQCICVSRFTASEVSRYYPSMLGRCTVISEAASLTDMAVASTDEACEPYFLFVGTLEPRKNLQRLLQAYAQLASQKSIPHLRIAGGDGWGDQNLSNLVHELGVESRVELLGFVDDRRLAALYRNAVCVLMPSLYEGFGLPVMEAMSFGVPAIAASTSSLPEVIGDSGLLVNPYSVADLSAAMLKMVERPELRQQLAERALQRSDQFSWSQAAEQTLDVFERVVEQHRPQSWRRQVTGLELGH